ncbi:MAG: hypothetical protein INH41_05875 [Myxococcaceae bacterium]|jgi:hypothetical protein|nr:hypothetical protein [Myxococcaceae bacterium]MCA3011914.1 hypothetical protein [Myxococcaceae bacterium]
MTNRPDGVEQELETLRERLHALEARERRRARRLLKAGAALVVCATLGVCTALAADGNCPNGMPFCFQADQPARASEVNHNFAQLREWLEAKVGVAGTGVRLTSDLSTTSRIIGGNVGGNLHLDAATGATYLNWYSGTAGTYFGNGAQGQVGRIDGAGNLTLSGSVTATGISATTVTASARVTADSLQVNSTGGNVPFGCVVRTASGTYNVACQANEIAVGGGGRCSSLWRLTESLPWGGASDTTPWVAGQPARAWRSVCQVWGNDGAYAPPQFGAFAICCRQ